MKEKSNASALIGIELAMMGRGGNTALDVAMCDISFFAESFLWL